MLLSRAPRSVPYSVTTHHKKSHKNRIRKALMTHSRRRLTSKRRRSRLRKTQSRRPSADRWRHLVGKAPTPELGNNQIVGRKRVISKRHSCLSNSRTYYPVSSSVSVELAQHSMPKTLILKLILQMDIRKVWSKSSSNKKSRDWMRLIVTCPKYSYWQSWWWGVSVFTTQAYFRFSKSL